MTANCFTCFFRHSDAETILSHEKIFSFRTLSHLKILKIFSGESVSSFSFTLTLHLAVWEPSLVVTVITALPAETAVTLPSEETVATSVLSDDHVTFLLLASLGDTVATRVAVDPTSSERDVLLRLTEVTATVFFAT